MIKKVLYGISLAVLLAACTKDGDVDGGSDSDNDGPYLPAAAGYIGLSDEGTLLSLRPLNPAARSYTFTLETGHPTDCILTSVYAPKKEAMRAEEYTPGESIPNPGERWMECTTQRLDSTHYRVTLSVEENKPWKHDEEEPFHNYTMRKGEVTFSYYYTPAPEGNETPQAIKGLTMLRIEQNPVAVGIDEGSYFLQPIEAPLKGFTADDYPQLLQESLQFGKKDVEGELIFFTSKEDSTWLTLTANRYADDLYLYQKLAVAENGRPAKREGKVMLGMRDVFGNIDSMRSIPVVQEGYPRIAIASENLAATNAAQTIELKLRSNAGRPQLTSSAAWAKVDGVVGTTNHAGDMDTITYRLTLAANPGALRTATLTATAGAVKQTYAFTQYDATTRFAHVDASTRLSQLFTKDEMFDIETLVVSGDMTQSDFQTMRTDMTTLQQVDLSGTSLTGVPIGAFAQRGSIRRVVLPNSVESIGISAFAGCEGLEEVNIPSGVTSIGSSAFYGCARLKQVAIPAGLTKIEYDTFAGCKALTSIAIPEGVTEIGGYAFMHCEGLTELTLPASLKALGRSPSPYPASESNGAVFMGCTNLRKVTMKSVITMMSERCFCSCENLTDIDLSKVEIVGYGAFADCKALKSVNLSSVRTLYEAAFSGCTSLTSVSLPTSLTSVYDRAFEQCTSLVSVTLPKSLTQLPRSMFEGCTALPRIDIPASIISFGEGVFRKCSSLSEIIYRGSTVPMLDNQVFKQIASPATLYVPAAAVPAFKADAQWGAIGEVKAL